MRLRFSIELQKGLEYNAALVKMDGANKKNLNFSELFSVIKFIVKGVSCFKSSLLLRITIENTNKY